jgi:cell wall-associated NlpC family hydrolase
MPARPPGRVVQRPAATAVLVALTTLASLLATLLPAVGPVAAAAAPAASRAHAALSPSAAGTAIRWGMNHRGLPYGYGATGPRRFDCSGFTRAAYASAGVALTHSSRAQYQEGRHIDRSQWRPGDLIFWASDVRRPSTIYHVGMYVGGGRVLHATEVGDVSKVAPVFHPEQLLRFAGRPGPSR